MAHLPNRPIAQLPKNLRVAFFGTPRLAQIVLENLVASPYKPVLIVTAPDTKAGRGQNLLPSLAKQTALKHKIEVIHDLSSIIHNQFDLAILVAYGKIIPEEILAIPKYGFVNVHPSLLPKYRGPSPIQSAILEGEENTGVTIIKLDEAIDHGPILAQSEVAITNGDTHASLVEKLGELGAKLLIKTLPKYLAGKIKPSHQDNLKATFTKRITKQDGEIDLLNPPNPLNLNRMIRAYYPWPGTWCRLTVHSRQFTVKFLPGNLIQPEGKHAMSISEFRNGYPEVFQQISRLFESEAQS